jgi:hypothetical protein
MTTISAQSEDLNATSGESHVPVGEGRDAVGRIETRGVDYIPHVERNSSPRTVFWAFEGPQFSLGTYIFGGAMVAAGLSWWACVAATILGVGIGSTAVSLVGMIGPRTGTNSTVSSGAFFGVRGRYLGSDDHHLERAVRLSRGGDRSACRLQGRRRRAHLPAAFRPHRPRSAAAVRR